jgi:pyridoxamine 5'-phosphate oxidase
MRALTLQRMSAFASALIAEGLENPSSPLRKPALATVGEGGVPAVRTVILRSADETDRLLGIFTDARSPKVTELQRNPRASLLFHDPRCDMQLRLSGKAEIRVGDEVAWGRATAPSRRAYLVTAPPGTLSSGPVSGLPADVEGIIPPLESLEEGRANFALIEFHVEERDMLILGRAGNRRARFRYEGGREAGNWLVP